MPTRPANNLYLIILFLSISIFLFPREPLAAPYYQGKSITIIVGSLPGGGNDRNARIIGKYLPKYIPGNPYIIIQNVTGAGAILAANNLYAAKPDGLTIGQLRGGLAWGQLSKTEGVRYDVKKFSWIGETEPTPCVFSLRTDLNFKTFNDLKKSTKLLHVGAGGPWGQDHQFSVLVKTFLGVNLKISMYPSNAEQFLAIERGELDGKSGPYTTILPHIKRGLLVPLVRGRVSEPGMENLPVDEDLTNDPMGKKIMVMRSASDFLGRTYASPPGTPLEVMKILREAFAKALSDTELQKDAKKQMATLKYFSADEVKKTFDVMLNQPKDIVREFNKYVTF